MYLISPTSSVSLGSVAEAQNFPDEGLLSPKETLKIVSCGSENGQKRTLDKRLAILSELNNSSPA